MGQSAIKNLGNGGEMDGDVTITGDLAVQGGISLSVDEVIQGTQVIDVTNTEALLVRKNGDGGDVFVVDTTNSKITLNSELQITSTGVASSPALAIDNSTASTFIHSAEIFAGSMTANQTNAIFIGRVGSTKNSAQIGFKYSSAGANANLLTLGHWGVNESLVIDGAGNVGIGASPIATHTDYTSLTVGGLTTLTTVDDTGAGGFFSLGHNLHVDTDNSYEYIVTDEASMYQQINGTHKFFVASSGSAGADISLSTPLILNNDSSATFAGDVTVSSATDTKPILKLEQTGNNVNAGQFIFLTSGTANDNDISGVMRFKGMNDAGTPEEIEYATIYAKHTDVSDGSEDSELHFRTMSAGSLDSRLTLSSSNATFAGDIRLSNNKPLYASTTGGATTSLVVLNSSNNLMIGQSNANHATATLHGGTGNVTIRAGSALVSTFDTSGNTTFAGDISVPATNKLRLDGASGHSYIYEHSNDDVRVYVGGTAVWDFLTTGAGVSATGKLHLDGGGDTYIQESSANVLKVFTGGTQALEINASQNATFAGNVGIGIVPVATFQVKTASDVNFTLSANSGDLRINAVNDAVDGAVGLEFNGADYEFLGTGTATFGGSGEFNRNDSSTTGADTNRSLYLKQAGSGDVNLVFSDNQHSFNMGIDNSANAFKISTHSHELHTNTQFTLDTSGNATLAGTITTTSSTDEKIMLKGSNSPYIRFYEGTTAKAYLQWHSDGVINLENQERSTKYAMGATHAFTGGNVGVGTASPASEGGGTTLHIAETGGSTSAVLTLTGGSGGNGSFTGQIQFNDKDDTDERIAMIGASQSGTGTPPGGKLHFYTQIDGGALTEALNLDASSRISLSNNDSGADNTVFGFLAGASLGSGNDRNVLIGDYAGTNVEADSNVMIGRAVGDAITSGAHNILIGDSALGTATTATENVAIGSDAMSLVQAGQAITGVIAIGQNAIKGGSTTTAIDGTVAIGKSSLSALTSGGGNTAIGREAGLLVTDNTDNTIIGHQAFNASDSGDSENVVIGSNAGGAINHGSSDGNVLIGLSAGLGGTGAMANCIAIGKNAMKLTAGNGQDGAVAIGTSSLGALTSGTSNTAVGYESLKVEVNGDKSTAIGYSSLKNQTGTSGAVSNTALGFASGDGITTGTSCTIIGSEADPSAHNSINQTVIGQGATGVADNSVTLGNASVTKIYMNQNGNGKVILGTIEFDASQATLSTNANTLDDYEEGDYDVAITMASGTATVSGAQNRLAYTKIGQVCHVQGEFAVSAISSPSGLFSINLPFTSNNSKADNADRGAGVARMIGFASGDNGTGTFQFDNNSASANLKTFDLSGNPVPTTSTTVYISISFITA